jgi:hypothetical protein
MHQTVTMQIRNGAPRRRCRGSGSFTEGCMLQIGAVSLVVGVLQSARAGFLVSLALFAVLMMICVAFLSWMRRASARS